MKLNLNEIGVIGGLVSAIGFPIIKMIVSRILKQEILNHWVVEHDDFLRSQQGLPLRTPK